MEKKNFHLFLHVENFANKKIWKQKKIFNIFFGVELIPKFLTKLFFSLSL